GSTGAGAWRDLRGTSGQDRCEGQGWQGGQGGRTTIADRPHLRPASGRNESVAPGPGPQAPGPMPLPSSGRDMGQSAAAATTAVAPAGAPAATPAAGAAATGALTTAAAAAAWTPATAAAAAARTRLLVGLVDDERATCQVVAIQGRDGRTG